MTPKVRALLDELAEKITGDAVAEYVGETLFGDGSDIPCRAWSRLNRLAVAVAGTNDARGIRQWNKAGRMVKKGAHAFYILVPMVCPATPKKQAEAAEETEDETEFENDAEKAGRDTETKLRFKLMPVFRVQDTEGAPLDYEARIKSFDVASLPLIEVAMKLGVRVAAGLTLDCAGFFRPKTKSITLGTANPQVFLHELSHAIDYALPNRRESDYAFGEVVAELSSAFLGSFYGVKVDIASTKAYIESWSGKGHVAFKVMRALQRVEEIYRCIESVAATPKQPKRRTPAPAGTPGRIPDETPSRTPKTGAERARKQPVRQWPKAAAAEQPDAVAGDDCLFSEMPPFRGRTQTFNPKTGKWVKRDGETGLFRSVKKDGKPYRRVLQEAGSHVIDFPAAMRER
jgi:antirestriction protein ArdC